VSGRLLKKAWEVDFSLGMATTLQMYRSEVLDANYTYPGGKLWDGEKAVVDRPE
jgi:hypothetical protein